MMEHRPSLPKTLKLPRVTRPTMAVWPSAAPARAWMRLSNPLHQLVYLILQAEEGEAMVRAFFSTLATTPVSVSVAR